MNIVVDAMGGDNAPIEAIKGCIMAVRKFDVTITLVGKEEEIKKNLKINGYSGDKIHVENATEVIINNESPTKAIRSKKDSSMVVGLKMIKEGKGDAFISAGSTGALLAGALFIVGRIRGIDRPALVPYIPTKTGGTVIVDGGANVDCKPINLVQFAKMANIYLKEVLKISNPKIGLLNIGAEEEKGNALTKEVYGLLKQEKSINFYGNVEGREVVEGVVDALVCDGFAGNVLLKTYEGTAMTLFSMIKSIFLKSALNKLAALILKGSLKDMKKNLDYGEVGGAPFIGVNGVIIKAHGSSDANAFMNAIGQVKKFVENNFVDEVKKCLEAEQEE